METSFAATQAVPQETITFDKARRFLHTLARARVDRRVTSDDVVDYINSFFPGQTLGPAMGVLFRCPEWENTGARVKSKVPTSHHRLISVWQLKDGF